MREKPFSDIILYCHKLHSFSLDQPQNISDICGGDKNTVNSIGQKDFIGLVHGPSDLLHDKVFLANRIDGVFITPTDIRNILRLIQGKGV